FPFQHFRVVHLGVTAVGARRCDELVVLDVENLGQAGAGGGDAFHRRALGLALGAYEAGFKLGLQGHGWFLHYIGVTRSSTRQELPYSSYFSANEKIGGDLVDHGDDAAATGAGADEECFEKSRM